MDQQTFRRTWDFFRQKYGIYLRLLEALPEDCFHDHPIDGMRTPAQLVVHTSGSIVRGITKGIASGTIEAEEQAEDGVAAEMGSKDAVIAFARSCWKEADAAAAEVGDEELAAEVGNPWGMPLHGVMAVHITNDEFMHHRGQLYAYARACGAEPPFMWSFQENDEAFRPREG